WHGSSCFVLCLASAGLQRACRPKGRRYRKPLSFRAVFERVGLHGVERIRSAEESPCRKGLLDIVQERVALRMARKVNRHAVLLIRRIRGGRAKLAHANSPQPRQCRPTQLVEHFSGINSHAGRNGGGPEPTVTEESLLEFRAAKAPDLLPLPQPFLGINLDLAAWESSLRARCPNSRLPARCPR